MSDQDEIAGLFALQTCARYLLRLPGHENYSTTLPTKAFSANGSQWFVHFLSTEHATLPQKAKELFGKILQDVTELNDRDARVGG